jgi:hypothetical protein
MAADHGSLGLALVARLSRVSTPIPGCPARPLPSDVQVGLVTSEQRAGPLGQRSRSPESPTTARPAPAAHGFSCPRRCRPSRPEHPSSLSARTSTAHWRQDAELAETLRLSEYTAQVTLLSTESWCIPCQPGYPAAVPSVLSALRSYLAPSTGSELPRPAHRTPSARSP